MPVRQTMRKGQSKRPPALRRVHRTLNFGRTERFCQTRGVIGFDSYGRIFHDAFELVSKRDFGSGVSVIGGVPSLKKAGPDPVGEIV